MRHQLHLIKTWLVKAKPTTSPSKRIYNLCNFMLDLILSLSLSLSSYFSWPCATFHDLWIPLGNEMLLQNSYFRRGVTSSMSPKMNIRFRRKNEATSVCNTWDFSTGKMSVRSFGREIVLNYGSCLIDRLVFLAGKSFPVTSKLAWEI